MEPAEPGTTSREAGNRISRDRRRRGIDVRKFRRGRAGLEYDLLLYVANWPERRSHAWKTLLQARAIENQCYVAGVNRIGHDGHDIYHHGDSMIIDPLGETLYHAGANDETFTLTLQKDDLTKVRQRFPFWRDADHFSIEP